MYINVDLMNFIRFQDIQNPFVVDRILIHFGFQPLHKGFLLKGSDF